MAELPPDPNQDLGFFNDNGVNRATGRVRVTGQPYHGLIPTPGGELARFSDWLSFNILHPLRTPRQAAILVEQTRTAWPDFVVAYPGPVEQVPQVPHRTTALGKRRRDKKEETLPPRGQTSGGLISTAPEWGVARILGRTIQQLGFQSGVKFPDVAFANQAIVPGYATGLVDNTLQWDFDEAAAAGVNPIHELTDGEENWDVLVEESDDSDVLSEDGPARWGG